MAWLPDDETLLRVEAGVQALQPMIMDDDSLVGKLDLGDTDLLICLGDLHTSTIEAAHERYQPLKAMGVFGKDGTSLAAVR